MPNAIRRRFSSLMNRFLTKRALVILCALWVLFTLIPLFALSFYGYPTHDDFPNVSLAVKAWANTGSFAEVVKAAWQQAVIDYNTWQGTFAAMFLCALQPIVFSMRLYWLSPVITLLLVCLSAWYLARQIARHILRTDTANAFVLFTALITVLVFSTPGVSELLYWHAAVQYTFSVIVMMLLCGLLIRLHQPQGKAAFALRTLLTAVLSFLLGGLPYTHALGGVVAMALVAAWCMRKKSPALLPSVIGFLAMLAALIIVIVAPGNAVRQARVGDSLNPIAAIIYSLEACLCCTADWFGPEWAGVALVLIPLLWPVFKNCPVRFRNPGWFSFFTFGVLAACYVPPIFATGVEGYMHPRIEGSLYMLWAMLGLMNLLYWAGWAAQRSPLSATGRVRTWHLAACAALVVCGAFASQAVFATPTIGAWKSLVTGEAAQFYSEMLDREQTLLDTATLEEAQNAVEPLSVQPPLFPVDMLIYQTSSRMPGGMRMFFELQLMMEEYGPGNIPQEVWDRYNAWDGGLGESLL